MWQLDESAQPNIKRRAFVVAGPEGNWVAFPGGSIVHTPPDRTISKPLAGAKRGEAGPCIIRAPMSARVATLSVKRGDQVKKGAILAVVEAMKMEYALAAPEDGRIIETSVQAGGQVTSGEALLTLMPEPSREADAP